MICVRSSMMITSSVCDFIHFLLRLARIFVQQLCATGLTPTERKGQTETGEKRLVVGSPLYHDRQPHSTASFSVPQSNEFRRSHFRWIHFCVCTSVRHANCIISPSSVFLARSIHFLPSSCYNFKSHKIPYATVSTVFYDIYMYMPMSTVRQLLYAFATNSV